MATVTMQLPDEALVRLQAGADAAGCSVGQLLTEIVMQALDGALDEPVDARLEAHLAQQVEDLANGCLDTRSASEVLAVLHPRGR